MLLPRLCHPERSRMIRSRIILRSRKTWCSPGDEHKPEKELSAEAEATNFYGAELGQET
jgi:hypothetical protein